MLKSRNLSSLENFFSNGVYSFTLCFFLTAGGGRNFFMPKEVSAKPHRARSFLLHLYHGGGIRLHRMVPNALVSLGAAGRSGDAVVALPGQHQVIPRSTR